MDKKLLNEIERIKKLMNINENEVNEGMKDLMKAALLCTVLATGEMSCKRPEEILPTEKSSDLSRSVDGNFTTKPKKYFDVKDIENIEIPQDSIEEASVYNPERPWVGIWKLLPYSMKKNRKEYMVWTSNGSNNIKDSKLYHFSYVSDTISVMKEFAINRVNVENSDGGFLVTIFYFIPQVPQSIGNEYELKFLFFDNNQKFTVIGWGDAGNAVRMNRIPYK